MGLSLALGVYTKVVGTVSTLGVMRSCSNCWESITATRGPRTWKIVSLRPSLRVSLAVKPKRHRAGRHRSTAANILAC